MYKQFSHKIIIFNHLNFKKSLFVPTFAPLWQINIYTYHKNSNSRFLHLVLITNLLYESNYM